MLVALIAVVVLRAKNWTLLIFGQSFKLGRDDAKGLCLMPRRRKENCDRSSVSWWCPSVPQTWAVPGAISILASQINSSGSLRNLLINR
jgi:hypothetical protein